MTITITLAPSEAHLLLAVLDEARKGQAFPISAYGLAGEAQIVGMFSRVSEAIRATRNPPVAELVDVDQADDEADAALEDLQPFGPVVPFTDSRGGQHRVQAQVFVRDGRPVEVRAGPIVPDDFLETVEAAFAEAFPAHRLRDWRAPTRDGRAVLADGLVAKVELVEEVTP